MAKRFKSLKRALVLIRNGANQDTYVEPPSGSALAEYVKYRKMEKVLDYTRSTDSKQKAMIPVAVRPFGYSAAVDGISELVRCTISQRVLDSSIPAGVKVKCNIIEDAAEMPTRKTVGFMPARATVKKAAGSETPETSKITGIKYNTKKAASFTFPYGQKTTPSPEAEVRADIVVTVKGLGAGFSVGFNSEEF
jgi:hypothetical protein